ncbi:MAG: TetR/AcrR family transcriptional regulator [Clostridium sp.]|uniref:TetR/AcrR family transcriptional regulator n=1 Tax=Clostridium sp. TaxID=1506 RepID=UPI0039EB312D
MISKFMNLEPEKREVIINAALEEFAQKGYKNASTNEIVKKANISKGLLFHYFSNKKKLFLFLYDYSKDVFLNEFYNKMNYDETDIIKRWRQIVLLKMELIQKYPVLYDFILASAVEDSKEIKQELENQMKNVLEDSYKRLFNNIDTSRFKAGMDIKRVLEIIFWVAQGFSNRELDHIKSDPTYRSHIDANALVEEFELYLDMLKDTFYK